MDFDNELLEPIKYYNYELKYKHDDKINAFIDQLTQDSQIDIEGNRQTCCEYYSILERMKSFEKKLGGSQGLRGFLIFLTVLFFIAGTVLGIVGVYLRGQMLAIFLPIGIFLILLGVGAIILNVKVISKRISGYSEIINKLRKESAEKKELATSQTQPLCQMFDWGIPAKLVSETTPLIQMDQNLSVERCNHMVKNYGWVESNPDNVSTVFIQSGTIVGNPFFYERDYIQNMFNKVYTGTLVISWTTTTTDSKGHLRVITHTQTLVAEVTRPAPNYYLDTALIYANEAAPKLSFSRRASGANSMSEKEIEKATENFGKKLQKKQEKDINKSFTPLGNTKFEYLFNALDRDNEVEFRLLFTPLAQKNMIAALTSKTPYGDDFRFQKKHMINVIHSTHAQLLDFDGNPYHFNGFDYDVIRNNFIAYNQKYFQGIYYDFVPLLSIPLYQQHRDYDPLTDTKYKGTVPLYEAEVLANFMDPEIFRPEDCDTNQILKATLNSCHGNVNIFDICSHGFKQIPKMEVVPKVGGDGHVHGVPVHYFEYEEVEGTSQIVVINVGGDLNAYRNIQDQLAQLISNYSSSSDIIYQRGLLAFPINEGVTTINGEQIQRLFSHKEA